MQLIWSQLLKLGAGVPFTQLPRNYKRSDDQKKTGSREKLRRYLVFIKLAVLKGRLPL